jgi:RNA polymerase sigma-70 factor (ECF subfamily)
MSKEEYNKKLIRNLQKGDIFSFDEIYGKYNRKIYFFSLSYLKNKDDAEGVVQEVFLNLWRKRAELKDQYNIDSYLFKIAHNLIRKHFNKLSRKRKFIEDYLKSSTMVDNSAGTDLEFEILLELAEKAINKLPSRQKSVYYLSMREGLTSEEISEKLNISKRTAENHLHRAKLYLKKSLLDKKIISMLFFFLLI